MENCTDCKREIDRLEVFPEGRCVECHEKVTPFPTLEELVGMWGGRV